MKVWQWLGYLGLVPFVLCLFFPWLITSRWDISPEQGFIFYSVIILSFLSGSLWRKDILAPNARSQLASIVFCLFAYLCLLCPLSFSLIALPFGYLGLLITEYLLCHNKEHAFSCQYFKMRVFLTLVVSLLHSIAFIRGFL
jgi:hypothetical protein